MIIDFGIMIWAKNTCNVFLAHSKFSVPRFYILADKSIEMLPSVGSPVLLEHGAEPNPRGSHCKTVVLSLLPETLLCY